MTTTKILRGLAAHDAVRDTPMGSYRTRPNEVPGEATERRTAPLLEFREVETNGAFTHLSAIAVPYGREADIGFFRESFQRGAFEASLKQTPDTPLLMFHDDRSFPLGHMVKATDEAAGLRGLWELNDLDVAQTAAKLAARGDLGFMSIRFQPITSKWTIVDDFNPELGLKDSVVRTEARLIETSLVSTPAYADARVDWVRSGERRSALAGPRRVDAWRDELERLRS